MAVKVAPSGAIGVTSRWRSTGQVLPNYLFILPYFVIFLVFSAGPLAYTIYMSLFQRSLFSTNPPFIGLRNYTDLWSDSLWLTVLWNTVEFVLISVTLITLCALGAALLLRAMIRGQTLLRTIFFAPAVLSVAIMAIIWNWLFSTDAGALNFLLGSVGFGKVPWVSDAGTVIPSLALATAWWQFGFPMIVFLAGLLNISKDLYEAAGIDGANGWQRFRSITLPLLRPTILFVLVTQIVAQFQVFGQSYFISQGGPGDASRTVLMYLYEVVWSAFRYGYGAAIAITLALIMAVITAINFLFLGRSAEA